MAAHKPWTPELLAELHRLWHDGVSATKIGLALGYTKNAVVGKARREGLPARDGRFAADLAIKPVTQEQRDTIRNLWLTHSVPQIRAITRIGWRRVIAIASELGLPSRAELIIERNKASPRRGAGVSGAQLGTPRSPRAARTRAAPPSARGGRASFLPPGATLPGVAPETLQQRRVFSNKLCKMVLSSDNEPLRFCDQPVIASAKGQNCASPYCLAHYAAAYIGTVKDAGGPKPMGFRA